jgi:hypothetical protein
MAAFVATMSRPELLTFDSRSYLNWSPSRTFAYPALLWLIGAIDRSYALVPYVQMTLLVVSAALLAEAGHRLRPAGFVWTLAGMAMLANPFIWRYAMQVLSESLYIALSMLFVACLALALRHRPQGLAWLGMASVALGLMILTRPDGYSLLVANAIGVAVWRPNRLRASAALFGPALACVLLASVVNVMARNTFATQISGGYNIVSNVAFFMPPDLPGASKSVAARIASQLRDVSAHLPRRTLEGASDYYWLTRFGFNPVLHEAILPILEDEASRDATARGEALNEAAIAKRVDAMAWDIARATIQHDPAAYAWHVAVHFAALWTFPSIGTAEEDARVRELLCGPTFGEFFRRRRGFCGSESMHPLRMLWPGAGAVTKNFALISLMTLSLALMPMVFLKENGSPAFVLAGLAALSINAHHLLVALMEVGLERYALATWPFLVVMVTATGLAGGDHLVRGYRARPPAVGAA